MSYTAPDNTIINSNYIQYKTINEMIGDLYLFLDSKGLLESLLPIIFLFCFFLQMGFKIYYGCIYLVIYYWVCRQYKYIKIYFLYIVSLVFSYLTPVNFPFIFCILIYINRLKEEIF